MFARLLLIGLVIATGIAVPRPTTPAEPLTMVFATVATSSPRLRLLEGQLAPERPGWFVELSFRAAEMCNARIDFAFMPWARALKMVEQGHVAAAFNSSYKPDRAQYGAYPMKDGKPDERRASKRYAYHAYIARDSVDAGLANEGELTGRRIVVERQASILPELKDRGAHVIEVANYLSMLRAVAGGRVDAAVGIDHNLDAILRRHPDLDALVEKIQVPVKKSVGFVMFAKTFYADHAELVECFWDRYAETRKSEWFRQMRATYP